MSLLEKLKSTRLWKVISETYGEPRCISPVSVDLTSIPDDLWQDLFIHWDFATQKRLSRCCQKWRQLLTASRITQTIIVDNVFYRMDYHDPRRRLWLNLVRIAITAVTADVRTVIFTRLTTGKKFCQDRTETTESTEHYSLTDEFLRILMEVDRPGMYHMVITSDPGLLLVASTRCFEAFGSLQLVGVKAPLSDVFQYLKLARQVTAPMYSECRETLYDWLADNHHHLSVGSVDGVRVGDDHTVYTGKEALTRRVLACLRSPCSRQMTSLTAQLRTSNLGNIQELVRPIMLEHQLNVPLSLPKWLLPLDPSRFNSISLWLLFAWTMGKFERPNLRFNEERAVYR